MNFIQKLAFESPTLINRVSAAVDSGNLITARELAAKLDPEVVRERFPRDVADFLLFVRPLSSLLNR